jgi:hypothetical protein
VGSYYLECGETWSEYYFEDHGETCEKMDTHHDSDDMDDVIIDDDGNTKRWCEKARDRWASNINNKWYSDDIEMVEYVTKLGDDFSEDGDEETESAPLAFLTGDGSPAFKCLIDGRYYANRFRHPENTRVATHNWTPTAPWFNDSPDQLSLEIAA